MYTTAYGFQHLRVLAGVVGRREAGRVHCVETDFRKSVSTQCTQPASRRPKTPASILSAENHMPCTPEDGHNGARNMLKHWFINKS